METSLQDNNNSIPDITFSNVEEYVKKLNGNKIINTILIANNGIAAVKCIRSIRKWSYETFGNGKAIQFVVMATPEDLKVNAEYIRMADQVEEVPGGSNINNYANVDLIVEIAEKRGVQAVWAGWGHASENPKLPEALSKTKEKIAFIGPPSRAMRDLGDKIASTIIAQSANVSCVPWNGSHITVNYSEHGIPDELFKAATVNTLEEAMECISKIGFPAMIKASEGGGGKGIRKVLNENEVESAFRQVQGEVPGSPIFIMKMLTKCRHLEVQILADQYGNAIALYGRDCSVQRRHQKIIEEGPAIAAPTNVWEQMEQAAVRMTKMVGYVGVGTVEYLFEEQTKSYYFLELNPRLQVEHPVTELITNVNLPATQLQVAMGIPLHRIPEIRKFYFQDPFGDSIIDFSTQKRQEPKGHVIAVRITGENPKEGFKPTSGGIQELVFRSTSRVWGYFSVGSGGGLHEYADSQFGHVFSHGDNREHARKELVNGLRELSIRGDISTTIEYLMYMLETQTFKKNQITTSWLDGLIDQAVQPDEKLDSWVVVICGVLYKAYTFSSDRLKQYISLIERGQVPSRDLLKIEDKIDLIYQQIKYQFQVTRSGINSYTINLKGKDEKIEAEVRALGDSGLLILLDAQSHVCYGSETVTGLKLILDGKTCLFTKEYDPTQLRTTTAGKLVRYLVENGSRIKSGTAYAEMEVMKMYMPLISTEAGKITFIRTEGSVLEPGSLIATLQLDDPSQIRRAKIYDNVLPNMKPPHIKDDKPHHLLRDSIYSIQKILAGYSNDNIDKTIEDFFSRLFHSEVPLLEIQECMSRISVKLPKNIIDKISNEIEKFKNNDQLEKMFTGNFILVAIEQYTEKLSVAKKNEILLVSEPLLEIARRYENGIEKYAEQLIASFLKEYLTVEYYYQQARDFVISELRQLYRDNIKKIYEIELSHANVIQKNKLILNLLDKIGDKIGPYTHILHEISDLTGPDHSTSALKARRMLTRFQLPSFEQRRISLEKELLAENYEQIIYWSAAIFDVLTSFFHHENEKLRKAALEIYIKRSYRVYEITEISTSISSQGELMAKWEYLPPFGALNYSNKMESTSEHSNTGIFRVNTDDNLSSKDINNLEQEQSDTKQHGIMIYFDELEHFYSRFDNIINLFENSSENKEFCNVLKIAIDEKPENWLSNNDEIVVSKISNFLQEYKYKLRKAKIRRITFVISKLGKSPRIFTFRERLDYNEHSIYRHIEPPLAYHLELRRLSNYNVQFWPSENQQIHIYYTEEKDNNSPDKFSCFFARAVIRSGSQVIPNPTVDYMSETDMVIEQAEHVLSEALSAIELARGDARYKCTWNNHIFMKFIPEIAYDPDKIVCIITNLAKKYEKRLGKLQVGEVELVGKLRKPDPNAKSSTVRFLITNPTGARFNIDAYIELRDVKKRTTLLMSLFGSGKLEGKEITEPYSLPTKVQKKRVQALSYGTTYIYDFIELFDIAVEKVWNKYVNERKNQKILIPPKYVEASELILDSSSNNGLSEIKRPPSMNTIGMIAWKVTLYTPEYPSGRQIILIGNDITFQSGSFGPQEDLLFKKASELARKEGLPRIYIAANSGARIGLAEEVKSKFNVEWQDESNPSKGFKYLYLTEEDYQTLSKTKSINAIKIDNNRWMLTDIIGTIDGLGVENLSGSGMIAGETSQAYEEIFTLTFVTGRTVGIGAYLVRLGQRTIQDKGPIILTGASALNKVLGRKVYSSNTQLGGIQIMYSNGISHIVVNDQMEGVNSIINWLSYIPSKRGENIPILDMIDPIERLIDFSPTKSPYDPRHMIQGYIDPLSNQWISGFFDKDSFTETLAGWAKTVVCGRARLGGIPVGVIAVETRTVEQITPADPAIIDSHENIIQQAGQVWFPDSAYKTAQAIQDFNKGEQLPLMIFANWRGFSGGLRDLFFEILKYGSYIVDNLREYKQPIFIYIPPFGELRGGAWVVVDHTINPDMMEMYCDENGRGGVLEPNGIVEIKYRDKDIIQTMHRLDKKLIELNEQLKTKKMSIEEMKHLNEQIQLREKELKSTYEQIAITFADLHDKPGRMKAKNVINDCISWKTSRQFFYFRLKRRIKEEELKKFIKKENSDLTNEQIISLIKKWIIMTNSENQNLEQLWKDDKFIINWIEKEKNFISSQLQELHSNYIQEKILSLTKENFTVTLQSIINFYNSLNTEQKNLLEQDIQKLKKIF